MESLWNVKVTFAKSLWEKGIFVCLKKGPHPFPRGDNNELDGKYWWNFKIFLKNHRATFALDTNRPWVKGNQFCSTEGSHPFPTQGGGSSHETASNKQCVQWFIKNQAVQITDWIFVQYRH